MKTDQNTQTSEEKDLSKELDGLLKEAGDINKTIDETNADSTEKMNEIEKKVDESEKKINAVCSDMDIIEKEAGKDIERLMMEEAELLAEEDKKEQ